MIHFDEARKLILENTGIISGTEILPLNSCYNRILACDIISERNIPPADNSAMDGYAVISADTINATSSAPVKLNIIAEVQAGGALYSGKLTHGNAVRIMTGAQIPAGADAVIPFEDTEEKESIASLFTSVEKNENIRFAGEDIKSGNIVFSAGTRIDSAQIGQIASMNLTEVPVFRKPRVSIISTGDEIVEPGSADADGKIINSNAYVLFNEVQKYGGDPEYLGIAKDNYDDVKEKFEKAMGSDIIICSGGVSMGRYDFIPDVLKSYGTEILIHKIAMKPGKPVVFGILNNSLFFGLPGNPVSVMISFIEFVRPSLLKLCGSRQIHKPEIRAVLKETIHKKPKRRHFVRGIYTVKNGTVFVKTTGEQGSGILSSMAAANCLIILPEGMVTAEAGTSVTIQLIQHGEVSVSG